MNRTTIFMFSGQGSQYYHMGKELMESNTVFQTWMRKLDKIVQKHVDVSLVDIIYNDSASKSDSFDRTLHTHPAIFCVEFALAQVLIEHGIVPDYIMGSSLGEYAAATLAGVFNLEEAIEAIMKQAIMLESLGNNSGMLAILDNVSLYHDNALLHKNTEIAGVNFDGHFVVSGMNNVLNDITCFLKEKDIVFQMLPVSQGFHSAIIDEIAWDYMSYLNGVTFNSSQVPFISGARACEISEFSPDYFWEVIRNPMLFQDTIRYTEENLAGSQKVYIDLGPSGTLATFIKYILGNKTASMVFPILTPFAQDVNNINKIKDFYSV